MNAPQILVIEQDEETRLALQSTLAREHYRVSEASTASAGVLLATRQFFDAIVLDPGFPDGSGIDVIRRVRQARQDVPVIVCSTATDEPDRITALDAGADDFIAKPIAMGELLARVRAALRRTAQASGRTTQSIYRTGEIQVNLNTRQVDIAGRPVHLTDIEFKLLEVLIRYADRIVPHKCLLSEVWGPDHAEQAQYLRTYMLQLRRKLETNPEHPRYLLTERGAGYRLVTQHSPEAWRM
jgi:two-component system KDP operon response regulator KdpE